jgi:hypothetical protein
VSERLKKAETPVTRPEEAAKTPPPVKEPEAKPRAPEPSGPTYGEGAAKASLRVASNPSGAEIFINGEYKGTTPATISDIKPGSVSLLVSKEGKSRFSQRISLSPGESKDMGTLKLAGLYGSVSINTSPAGAKVYFDGDEIGARTPLTIKKVQRDKAHSLRLVLDGYQDWQSNFEMGNEDEKKFNVTMEK